MKITLNNNLVDKNPIITQESLIDAFDSLDKIVNKGNQLSIACESMMDLNEHLLTAKIVTKESLEMYQSSINSIVSYYPELSPYNTTFSLEDNTEAEKKNKVIEFFKKMWRMIVNFFKSIYKKVKDFILRIYHYLTKSDEKLKETVADINKNKDLVNDPQFKPNYDKNRITILMDYCEGKDLSKLNDIFEQSGLFYKALNDASSPIVTILDRYIKRLGKEDKVLKVDLTDVARLAKDVNTAITKFVNSMHSAEKVKINGEDAKVILIEPLNPRLYKMSVIKISDYQVNGAIKVAQISKDTMDNSFKATEYSEAEIEAFTNSITPNLIKTLYTKLDRAMTPVRSEQLLKVIDDFNKKYMSNEDLFSKVSKTVADADAKANIEYVKYYINIIKNTNKSLLNLLAIEASSVKQIMPLINSFKDILSQLSDALTKAKENKEKKSSI